MTTDAGARASTWRDLDVTRWREDATRDCWGQFVYVRCPEDGRIWSIGHQPIPRGVAAYQVAFHADRADFRRRDGDVETCCAICVARDYDAEVRLVTLVNHGGRAPELDLTSYAEVCLNYRRADQGHPAFVKMFLETEFVPGPGALLARRKVTRYPGISRVRMLRPLPWNSRLSPLTAACSMNSARCRRRPDAGAQCR